MTTTEFTFTAIKLLPEEGMLLTQAQDVALADRVFSPMVILGNNGQTQEDWREISEQEASEMKTAQAAEREKGGGDYVAH